MVIIEKLSVVMLLVFAENVVKQLFGGGEPRRNAADVASVIHVYRGQ